MGDRKGELDRIRDEDLGQAMGVEIQRFLDGLGVPRGLKAVGYQSDDIGAVSTS